jgi:hypothetical protein
LATNKNRSGTSTRGIHTRACSSGVATAEHRQRWSSFCRAGPDQLEGQIPFFRIPFSESRFPNPVFRISFFRISFFLIPFFLILFSESRFFQARPGRPDLHTRAPSRTHARSEFIYKIDVISSLRILLNPKCHSQSPHPLWTYFPNSYLRTSTLVCLAIVHMMNNFETKVLQHCNPTTSPSINIKNNYKP